MIKISAAILIALCISCIYAKENNFQDQQKNYSNQISSTVEEILKIREINQGWSQRIQGKYLNLFTTEYKQNKIYLKKVVGVIPAPFEKAVKYYSEVFDNTEFTRNSQCGSQKLIEKIDENSLVTLYKGEGNIFASSREHLTIQNKKQLTEDEVLITRTTINDYHNVPIDTSAIRINGIYGIFLKKLADNQTQFEAYFQFDIGGYVPYFLVNTLSDHQHEVLENDVPFINRL